MSISILSANYRTLKVYLIFIHHLNTLLNSFYQLCLGIIASGSFGPTDVFYESVVLTQRQQRVLYVPTAPMLVTQSLPQGRGAIRLSSSISADVCTHLRIHLNTYRGGRLPLKKVKLFKD